jgi:hypothetical protein
MDQLQNFIKLGVVVKEIMSHLILFVQFFLKPNDKKASPQNY